MSYLPKFRLKISKSAHLSEGEPGITSIIIMRPYAHLERELRNTFKEEDDVKVILDKRYEERRKKEQAVATEHRKTSRRRPKEELVEVVIST